MSLLTQQDILDYQGIQAAQLPANWQSQLDMAENDCAEYLGSDPFPKVTVTITDYEVRDYTKRLIVERGLLTSLTSLTLDGVDISGDVEVNHWELYYEPSFRKGETLAMTYELGWDTSADMPRTLYFGILQTYERHGNYRGAGILRESIGDFSTTYSHAATRDLPGTVQNDIVQFRRPRIHQPELVTIR